MVSIKIIIFLAADVAFDAAVDSPIQLAEGADAADVAALLFVRERLTACGVNGPAATYLTATSIPDLRAVGAEVLGDDLSELKGGAP